MRKVYLFDIGLLVLAGAVAGVLTDEPNQTANLLQEETAGEVFDRQEIIEQAEDSDDSQEIDRRVGR